MHEPSGWSMAIICLFDKKENKFNYYRGKDCIKKLCKKIKESANEIISPKKKEMIPLTKEENNIYNKQKTCHKCKEKFRLDKDDENYINKKKVKDHCHNICNLKYKSPKEIPIIIFNASYDTHFMIYQLAAEFKGELNCIGDNMEKYITFSVPIKKEFINDGNKKTITCKLKLIDSYRFMQASLSELADNMSGIFNTMECESFIEKKKLIPN